ncbi:MAG: hypothetical protein QOE98_2130 [Gaiellaceae bacterium]|jgi:hypothetical protein|nr:hypothetical protein [Gaiellaceae bacterium]
MRDPAPCSRHLDLARVEIGGPACPLPQPEDEVASRERRSATVARRARRRLASPTRCCCSGRCTTSPSRAAGVPSRRQRGRCVRAASSSPRRSRASRRPSTVSSTAGSTNRGIERLVERGLCDGRHLNRDSPPRVAGWLDDRRRLDVLLRALRRIRSEDSLIGAGPHFLGVGRRSGQLSLRGLSGIDHRPDPHGCREFRRRTASHSRLPTTQRPLCEFTHEACGVCSTAAPPPRRTITPGSQHTLSGGQKCSAIAMTVRGSVEDELAQQSQPPWR